MCTYTLQKHKHKKMIVAKMLSLICVLTIYNNKNINKKARLKNDQYYMFTYTVQQHKHKYKGLFPKMPSLTFVHTLYNKKHTNTKSRFQNSQAYMCTYNLQ